MSRFEGQVCIITASATGIGLAIAQRLAREGAKVVVSSRNQSRVDQAVASIKAEGKIAAGVAAHAAKDIKKLVDFAVSTFGGIDLVVSNAAISLHFGPMMETTGQMARKTLDTNVVAGFLLIQEALPYLEKSKSPSVLFLSSYVGYKPNNFLGFYSVSKTALLGLVKCLAQELATKGIRVNGIAPGVVRTGFSESIWETEEAKNNPMGRMAQPEEIAALAAFLLSAEASYISGEMVVAAGGLPTRL